MTRLLVAFLVALILGLAVGRAVRAQDAKAPTPQQQFAQAVADLGQCQYDVSRYKAAVLSGLLFDAVQVKNKIEAANPEYTFDPQTFVVTRKPSTEQ